MSVDRDHPQDLPALAAQTPERGAPGLRYRSARQVGQGGREPDGQEQDDALSPAEALVFAFNLREQGGSAEDAQKILLGLARRADLDTDTLQALCRDCQGNRGWSVRFELLLNPAVNHLPCVRALVGPDLLSGMLEHPEVFAAEIVRLIGHRPAAPSLPLPSIEVVRERVGVDRINAILTEWITGGDPEDLKAAASTPLLTDQGWALLLGRAETERVVSERDRLAFGEYLGALARRADLTDERGLAIVRLAKRTGNATWIYLDLCKNPATPVAVFAAMTRLRARRDVNIALLSEYCPDRVRWETAVRKHWPDAILRPTPGYGAPSTRRVREPIPADAAHAILDDLDADRSRRERARLDSALKPMRGDRTVADRSARKVRERIALLADDPGVLGRLLGDFMRIPAEPGDSAAQGITAFFMAAVSALDDWRTDADGRTRKDMVLELMAAHPDEQVRAVVVPFMLHPGDLVLAAGDPSPVVRLAVARHKNLSRAAYQRLVEDPDEGVREVIMERFFASLT